MRKHLQKSRPRPRKRDRARSQAPAAEPARSSKRARVRTVGKKIVDRADRSAQERARYDVLAPWCFICDRARTFLEAREVDLVATTSTSTPMRRSGSSSSTPPADPDFIVDGKTIVGFHPWGLEDAVDVAAQEHYCMTSSQGAVCERLASAK